LLLFPFFTSIGSFLNHVTGGATEFDANDVPALMVLNEYLSTMEGPFWKQVRGNGLAYGASLRLDLESSKFFLK
jgi:Zn-dependent M16 (insulinase) family peptidase